MFNWKTCLNDKMSAHNYQLKHTQNHVSTLEDMQLQFRKRDVTLTD